MRGGHSLHRITAQGKSCDFEEISFGFDPATYSKFKFGDKDAAREFGYALAKSFVKSVVFNAAIFSKKQMVIISSPYCFIPTATFAMKNYFVQFLNQELVQRNFPVLQETKIHRTITYKEDYGELSAEERMKLISKDGFEIDLGFIKDKFLIFLDDIKITGSHERVIERMMTEQQITNDHAFVYFAELIDSSINPKVENYLNYYYVKNLLDLDKIIKNKNFLFNTRVVKYILNYKDEVEFNYFINYQAKRTLATLYHLALGNSYHTIPDYQKNLKAIENLLIQYNFLLK